MGEPTTENKTAGIVNKILNGLIEGAGVDALKVALTAEFPWLGLPFVKQLFSFILDKVAAAIYKQAAFIATKIVIDMQVKQEVGGVNNAFDNLTMAVASGDQIAIDKASANLSTMYGNLIHYDGSSSP